MLPATVPYRREQRAVGGLKGRSGRVPHRVFSELYIIGVGMGRWFWKHSLVRQVVAPLKPKVVMGTVGGVTHRLRWADRNAGWRMRCSCGWIDARVRWSERKAIAAGNQHVQAARWASLHAARQERRDAKRAMKANRLPVAPPVWDRSAWAPPEPGQPSVPPGPPSPGWPPAGPSGPV